MRLTVRDYFKYTSWPIIAAGAALIVIGVLTIHTSEISRQGGVNWQKQIIWACAGVTAFWLATFVPYQGVGRAAYVIFGATLVLLLAVFLFPATRHSHRWIPLGIGVKLQPAEAAKLAFVILLAWYLRRGEHYRRPRGLIVPFVLTFVPMGLILKEPDLGTSLVFVPTLYVMLFMAGAKLRHLLSIMAVATAILLLPIPWRVPPPPAPPAAEPVQLAEGRTEPTEAQLAEAEQLANEAAFRRRVAMTAYEDFVNGHMSVAYGSFEVGGMRYAVLAAPLLMIESHQLERVEGWLHQGDPGVTRRIGMQLRRSKMTLGSRRWGGWGNWHEKHAFFDMLPDDHTDFIFAVIGGRWGLAGCVGVLALYAVIVVFGLEIAVITADPFGRLLAIGVVVLLVGQVVINMGMAMGLMPITGMTLPLVSYGGSSLVMNCAALGLLVNVGQRRPIMLGRKPFEYGQPADKPHAYEPIAKKYREQANEWK